MDEKKRAGVNPCECKTVMAELKFKLERKIFV
jgi:hypothetical protein